MLGREASTKVTLTDLRLNTQTGYWPAESTDHRSVTGTTIRSFDAESA